MSKEFNDENFETEVLKSDLPVLVDFFAEWCAPCRMMGPIIDELAGEYKGKAKVGKVNVDASKKTAEVYNVLSIPTFIIFKDGKKEQEFTGIQSKESIKEALDKYL